MQSISSVSFENLVDNFIQGITREERALAFNEVFSRVESGSLTVLSLVSLLGGILLSKETQPRQRSLFLLAEVLIRLSGSHLDSGSAEALHEFFLSKTQDYLTQSQAIYGLNALWKKHNNNLSESAARSLILYLKSEKIIIDSLSFESRRAIYNAFGSMLDSGFLNDPKDQGFCIESFQDESDPRNLFICFNLVHRFSKASSDSVWNFVTLYFPISVEEEEKNQEDVETQQKIMKDLSSLLGKCFLREDLVVRTIDFMCKEQSSESIATKISALEILSKIFEEACSDERTFAKIEPKLEQIWVTVKRALMEEGGQASISVNSAAMLAGNQVIKRLFEGNGLRTTNNFRLETGKKIIKDLFKQLDVSPGSRVADASMEMLKLASMSCESSSFEVLSQSVMRLKSGEPLLQSLKETMNIGRYALRKAQKEFSPKKLKDIQDLLFTDHIVSGASIGQSQSGSFPMEIETLGTSNEKFLFILQSSFCVAHLKQPTQMTTDYLMRNLPFISKSSKQVQEAILVYLLKFTQDPSVKIIAEEASMAKALEKRPEHQLLKATLQRNRFGFLKGLLEITKPKSKRKRRFMIEMIQNEIEQRENLEENKGNGSKNKRENEKMQDGDRGGQMGGIMIEEGNQRNDKEDQDEGCFAFLEFLERKPSSWKKMKKVCLSFIGKNIGSFNLEMNLSFLDSLSDFSLFHLALADKTAKWTHQAFKLTETEPGKIPTRLLFYSIILQEDQPNWARYSKAFGDSIQKQESGIILRALMLRSVPEAFEFLQMRLTEFKEKMGEILPFLTRFLNQKEPELPKSARGKIYPFYQQRVYKIVFPILRLKILEKSLLETRLFISLLETLPSQFYEKDFDIVIDSVFLILSSSPSFLACSSQGSSDSVSSGFPPCGSPQMEEEHKKEEFGLEGKIESPKALDSSFTLTLLKLIGRVIQSYPERLAGVLPKLFSSLLVLFSGASQETLELTLMVFSIVPRSFSAAQVGLESNESIVKAVKGCLSHGKRSIRKAAAICLQQWFFLR